MPRFDKDYYKVLGVPETATPEEIKKAYRRMAKELHPDRSGGDKAKEQRFKEVNEAHEVLSDPPKRAQYDQMRKAGFSGDPSQFSRSGGADFGNLGGLEDLLGSFMDMGAFGRQAGSRARKGRGEDTAFALTVPFETAARGGRMTIMLPKEESCGECGGTGTKGGAAGRTCKTCRGSGMSAKSHGGFAFSRPCPSCMGSGTEPGPPCPDCRGEGVRRVERKLEVKIPAGVSTGSKIRLGGEGAPGTNGGPPGDCILDLTVAEHPDFEREGRDVTGSVEVDFRDAILGTEAAVPTLHGPVTLHIPPGTQPGARLRLRGQGVQGPDGDPGDHYVRVKVRLPRTLTEEQKKALEAFREGR